VKNAFFYFTGGLDCSIKLWDLHQVTSIDTPSASASTV
jgi:hypothetical protein